MAQALMATIVVCLGSLACGTTPTPPVPVPYATPSITPTATPCGAGCRLTFAVVAEGPPPTLAPPTPTTAPTRAPAAAAQAAGTDIVASIPSGSYPIGHYTPPDLQASIALEVGWPPHLIPQLLAQIRCESGGRAVQNNQGGPYYGMLQLEGPLWYAYFGYPFSEWTNPYVNLRVGWLTYGYYGGWGGWECQP